MQIEKNIPMPSPTDRRFSNTESGRASKYPFGEMEVGDSVLVDGESCKIKHCRAYGAARDYGDKYGKTFKGAKEPGQPGKVRIWRTA